MSKRLRVALLGLYPFQRDMILGGVEAVTLLLATWLARCPDVEVHVFTLRSDVETPLTRRDGAVQLHIAPQPSFGRLTWHFPAVRLLQKMVAAVRPDIVHGHGSDLYAAAAIRGHWPHVVTLHGVMFAEARTVWGWKKRLARELDRWFERWLLPQARDVVAISPYVAEAYPWLRAHLHFIENPVDATFFQAAGEAGPGELLTVARVIPRKGVLPLIEAFADVVRAHPEAQLRIAGEMDSFPDYAAVCRRRVRELDLLERVHFLGALDRNALLIAYRRATAVLLNSVQETAPVVVAEAMAAGRPVIATDVGGNKYMIETGRTGWLVPLGDRKTLSAVMVEALSAPEIARQRGEAARREAAGRFRPEVVAEKHMAMYREIVER